MNILDLLLFQRASSHQGTEIVIQFCVGLEGIEENTIAVVDHTFPLPSLFLNIHPYLALLNDPKINYTPPLS
jgi:hypothetical protein